MDNGVREKLDRFFSQYPKVEYSKGQIIIYASDDVADIYYIRDGYVGQSAATFSGNEMLFHISRPHSYFPMMLALAKEPNDFSFVALDSVVLNRAPLDDVIHFLEENPDVVWDLTKRFGKGLNGLIKRIETMLFADAYRKVITALMYFAKSYGSNEDKNVTITLPLTHAEIASWVGLQRETVSRQIEKLEQKGLIGYDQHLLVVHDMAKLQKELERDTGRGSLSTSTVV